MSNLFGLLYLWLRDSGLPLDEQTADYIRGHMATLEYGGDVVYSDDRIADFIHEHRLTGIPLRIAPVEANLLQRLRQLRNRDTGGLLVVSWDEGALDWGTKPSHKVMHLTG